MNLRAWIPSWGPDHEVKAFVADLNGVQYSSYTNQRLWIRTGNVVLAAIIWALLTDHVARLDGLTTFLAVWCGYLTGKSITTAASRFAKSKTNEKYVEAKERGKEKAKADAKPAAPAMHADTVQNVTLTKDPSAPAAGVDDSRRDDER